MPSTFTESLRLEEQGIGENNNTWGDKLNQTIDLIDKSIAGHISVATTGGTTQLTTVNNGEDQSRYKIIEITGTLGSNAVIEVPEVSKEYVVWDSTTRGGFTITFRLGAAGGETLIPASTARAFGISTDGVEWRPISPDLASETAPGIMEISSVAEAQAGTSNGVVLTPLRLQDVTATETRKGVIELATTAEGQAGTDAERAITAAVLQGMSPTETIKSPVRVATIAEARTGTDNETLVTPLRLQEVTSTETRKGVIEIATQAEVDNGTDTDRAVVPAKLQTRLKSYVDTRIGTTSNLSLGTASTKNVGTTTGTVSEVTYQEVTINSGDFAGSNAFTLKCYKAGRRVTLWTDGEITHAANALPNSDSGAIPVAFRPAATRTTLTYDYGLSIIFIQIRSDGMFLVTYRDLRDATPRAVTSSSGSLTITYCV